MQEDKEVKDEDLNIERFDVLKIRNNVQNLEDEKHNTKCYYEI